MVTGNVVYKKTAVLLTTAVGEYVTMQTMKANKLVFKCWEDYELLLTRSASSEQNKLTSKNQVARVLGQQILNRLFNLTLATKSPCRRPGSLKKSIEELNQELRIREKQNEPMESRVRLKMPKDLLETSEDQVYAKLVPLVEVARGGPILIIIGMKIVVARSSENYYNKV